MPPSPFTAEYARWGPEAVEGGPPLPLDVAQDYCKRLARTHYENFTVASWLLPRALKQPFCDVYAWCRWADDLADEDPGEGNDRLDGRLARLAWWRELLDSCFREVDVEAIWRRHPVTASLRHTIDRYDLPAKPFLDLLDAFRQDQRQARYETFADLLDYCRRSANPVGELVLRLGGGYDSETAPLSDSICTGLQLANFWQDVARDYENGRVYLPQESLAAYGVGEEEIAEGVARRRASQRFCEMLASEVDRCAEFFDRGAPLVALAPKPLRLDVALFLGGGRAILAAIRRQRYDVLSNRPTVSRAAKLKLLASSACRSLFSGSLFLQSSPLGSSSQRA